MRRITTEYDAVTKHLETEFGGYAQCPRCGNLCIAPPVGIPFEVLIPLKTEPHPIEIPRYAEFGLTPESCILPGIYAGLEREIVGGTSTHRLIIKGDETYGTKRICARTVNGFIDWRGARAIPSK